MKTFFLFSFILLLTSNAIAKKDCTDLPKEKWLTIKEFKKIVQNKGFSIRKFKQKGNCYEIYGKDKDAKEVEVYFDPTNANIKKIEFED